MDSTWRESVEAISLDDDALEFTEEDLSLGVLEEPDFQAARSPEHDPARQAKINRDMKVFQKHRLERLTVWLTPDGRYLVIDGGGRVWGMREIHHFPNDYPVPSRVFRTLTREQALELWDEMNRCRYNTTAIQVFRGHMLAGEEPYREIGETVVKYDMKIGKGKSDVSALGSLVRAHENDRLDMLLDIATRAYGSHGGAYLTIILTPLVNLLVRNKDKEIDTERLVRILKSYGSPANLEVQAHKSVSASVQSRSYATTDRFIASQYNSRDGGVRGKRRLNLPKTSRRTLRNV